MIDVAELDPRAVELAAQMVGQYGTIGVTTAVAEVDRDDEDELAVFLVLTLTDPVGDTWPYEDVLALRRAVITRAEAIGIETSLYVRLRPATDLPQEDDEPALFAM